MNTDQNPYNQGYPSQQFGGYPQQPNPYGQNQTTFQPPPVVPRPDFPKGYSGVPVDYDEQGGAAEWGNFDGLNGKKIRQVFVRKVYLILSIQLLITFGLIALFHFLPEVRAYVRSSNGQWLYFTSYVVFLVVYLALVCSKRAARRFPLNMILLGVLTISMGYMMGMISAFYTTDSVLKAVGITVFVCVGISLFSMQTKYDFTNCFGILFVISLALMGFGIVCIITRSAALSNIYAGLGAVLFSIFLAVDTQLIIGGKRHEISAEDHVFAAIMLYLDVVYIFIYILQLLGQRE